MNPELPTKEVAMPLAKKELMKYADIIYTSSDPAEVEQTKINRDKLMEAMEQKYGGDTIQSRSELKQELANLYSIACCLYTIKGEGGDITKNPVTPES